MDSFWKFAIVSVAAVAALIAYQQFWVAREKLRLDLFEKRFAVFEAARRFLSQILQHGTVSTLEELGRYRADVAEAGFLFDEDVTDFLTDIDQRAFQLWSLNETLKGTEPGPERTTLAEEMSIQIEWLTSQLVMLKPTFEPYMKFRNWHWSLWHRGSAAVERWTSEMARILPPAERVTESIRRPWRRWRRRLGR